MPTTKSKPTVKSRPAARRASAATPGRFGRTPVKPPPRFRGRSKPAKKTGLAGLLDALPVPSAGKAASAAGGKAKPAAALLAAGAGALLGRRQLRKRQDDREAAPSAPVGAPGSAPEAVSFPPAPPTAPEA